MKKIKLKRDGKEISFSPQDVEFMKSQGWQESAVTPQKKVKKNVRT